jgi:signal transduction histidine kinase
LSAADTLQYAQRHYTDENGLPQNSIKFIAPDKSGFVWLATENGVVRFDGQHFRTFNKDNIRLTSSRIYKLMPGRGMDRLYAATEVTQIISLQNGEAKLENGPRQPEGWIDSADSDQHFSFFQALGLPNIYQHVIRVDNYVIPVNGRDFFIINKDKVAYYQQKKLGFQTSFHHTSYWRFFSIDTVLYYLDDAAVYRFSRHDGEKKGTLKGDILLDPAFRRGDKKLELYWNISSRDVFIYLDRSLYLVEKLATGELHTRLLLTGFDLGINRIISAYYDRRYRRIFLGSETRGLYVFTRKEFKAIKSARPNADEVFYAQTAFGNTGVLSSKGEVLGLSETGRILPAIYRLHLIDHYSLLTDTSGFIWIKQRYKLFKFDRNGQHLLDEWTFTPSIRQLYDGSNGNLWIGTSGGLYRMDLLKKSSPPELVTDRVHEISYMQHETDDVLWLASLKGLYRLTISSGKVDTIRGMAGKYIRHVYVPHPNEVWITTAEEGLFLYKDGRLTKFPADQGRYLNAAHCLMEDGQGFYWITTNKGLFRAAKKDLLDYADHKINEVYYHYYDKYAGFNSNEFNGGCQPCGIKLPDGYWSFPSMNGLVLFRPEQQTMELPDKDIFIDRVEVDGKPLSQRDTVVLDKEFDLFKLYVSTPFFGNPQNLHLEYTLYRNTEKQVWNKIGNDGSVSLASLPSGTYLLQVRKLNGFGNNNYSYKNVVLKLPLAYYETWWFKACMVSLGLLGIWAYTRFRLQYIKHKNKMLETRIDERTTTLKTTLSELQASEDILRKQTHIQERLITAITHDIKSPLRYMMLSAKRLTKQSAGQEDPEDAQKNAEMLYEAGYRMYHLTDNLLQYIKLSSRDKQVVMEEVDLAALIGEKVEIFRDIAAAQQTVLLNEVPDRISIRSNSRLLGIVIHNVLDNAVKVTYEGQVSIYIVPDPMLQIIIEDTGIGMRQDMVDWCNTVHTEKEQLNAVPGHSGFGLVIIKELLALVNGELLVSSSQEKGTKVRLLFRER